MSELEVENNLLEPMKTLDRLRGEKPVIFLMLNPPNLDYREEGIRAKKLAEKLGWHVIDIKKVYKNYKASRVKYRAKDFHPSRFAHKLISKRLVNFSLKNLI